MRLERPSAEERKDYTAYDGWKQVGSLDGSLAVAERLPPLHPAVSARPTGEPPTVSKRKMATESQNSGFRQPKYTGPVDGPRPAGGLRLSTADLLAPPTPAAVLQPPPVVVDDSFDQLYDDATWFLAEVVEQHDLYAAHSAGDIVLDPTAPHGTTPLLAAEMIESGIVRMIRPSSAQQPEKRSENVE